MSDERQKGRPELLWAAIVAVLYPLSSGPVIAVGCKLRDVTGWDGFYFALVPYVPILDVAHAYISWWVRLLGTVGPG